MNQTQLFFNETGGAPTQTDRLISTLHAADGQWVGLPDLVAAVGGYAVHSRAADARKMGVNVENRVEYSQITKQRHSFYRLLAP